MAILGLNDARSSDSSLMLRVRGEDLYPSPRRPKGVRGRSGGGPAQAFTLLEVLIALVIVAVAVGALAHTVGRALNHHGSLEERALALWVADNVIAQTRIEGAATGRRQGQARQGGREWQWEALIQPAPGSELMRVDVSVFTDAERRQPVLTHTGFLPP